ncbi:FadR/GntR family transcriptional regulator [Elioraea sp.]|uniref:FadR/GntR family transcriptional regulator n=1 Tax=Elioraea sp. TaxID=2185103 RepID=UPI0025B9634B|nr:FCD domain-containing protein [Elioraea sp.]
MAMEAEPVLILREPDRGVPGVGRVIGYIKDAMLAGRLRPGDRLLPERDLAAALGVSRPVLREALRGLVQLGLVETRQGSGSVIRRPSPEMLRDVFTFTLAADAGAVEDVMEARVAIECQAIRLACTRAGPAELARVRAGLDGILATLDDAEAGGHADAAFHAALVAASASPTLIAMHDTLAELLLASHVARRRETIATERIRASLADAHRAVFAALMAREPDRADATLRAHFRIGDELRRERLAEVPRPAAG